MRPPPTHIPESLGELREEYARLAQDYQAAYDELLVLRRLAFGQRKESLTIVSDLQTRMEGLLGDVPALEAPDQVVGTHTRKARRKPRELECVTLIHDIPEAEKACPCGATMEKVGESHTLIRQYVPATCHHEDHVYPRYACAICQDEPRRALEPASPFEAQGVGSGLAAQIIISKHEDHLPLNRQEKILERHGIILSKSHMVDIIAHAHDLVKGIVEPIRQEVLSSGLVGMDESTVSVLDEKLKGTSHRGYFWTMGSQDAVVYRFDAGRSGQNITSLLGDTYSGYVVADGYSAYDPKSKPRSYTLINCWAHVRRKFFEIMKDQPIAREAVNKIAAMYHLESEARKSPDPLAALAETRRTLIGPLLDAFWAWLEEREQFVLPKSSLGAAIHYALERKTALGEFLNDPRIPMDNNQSERDLRHVVIGRKNWNFAGSYAGAERLATFFTLMQSCKRVKLNPWVYLTHVFSVIEDYSLHRLGELTPSRIKAALQARA
ncbi:MAG TPA: IS66 family transposase, partial [Fibrobacteria bacterium]|nr:IS66 family transposase [Fibrobacteria bacterium]